MRVRYQILCAAMAMLGTAFLFTGSLRADEKSDAVMDGLKKLVGNWVSEDPKQHEGKAEFKLVAGGSVLMETMLPGSEHEMVNMYHLDGDNVLVTHYCGQGIQPRMELKKSENGVYAFEFKDCTNLKSRDEAHMDSLTLTLDGDKLTEQWGYYEKGKTVSQMSFVYKRQK